MANPAMTNRGRATRARILKCALRLMWRHGYSEVSINRLTQEAGVLNGSFFHFFPSKLDLLLAMFDHLWALQSRQIARIHQGEATPEQALRSHINWICKSQVMGKKREGFVPGQLHMAVGMPVVEHNAAVAEKIERGSAEHRVFLVDIMTRINPEAQGLARSYAEILATFITGAIFLARLTNSLEPVDRIPPFVEMVIANLKAGEALPAAPCSAASAAPSSIASELPAGPRHRTAERPSA